MEQLTAAPELHVAEVEGLGRCAFVDSHVAAGALLLQEKPLLVAAGWDGLCTSPLLLEDALDLKIDEDEDIEGWENMSLWSGAALSQAAAEHLLGLFACYMASPVEVRRAVLEFDDAVQNGAALKLLRELADLVLKHAAHHKLRRAEISGVFRIIWVNAFPFQSSAALFSKAACCAHGCRPNAFFSSDGEFGRIVALEELEKGSRIELCYISRHYALLPTMLRQRYLRFARGFNCRCGACEETTEEINCNLVGVSSTSNHSRFPITNEMGAAKVGLQPSGLHVCCCVAPWSGHMLPMLRIARALCDRPQITKVSFMTDAFGAVKVRQWLDSAPDQSGKLRVTEFEDGYDRTMDKEIKQVLSAGDGNSACDVNLLIEVNVGEHLRRLIEEGVSYFIVDWHSYGFSKHLSAFGVEYCISMPTSAVLAQYFDQHLGSGEQGEKYMDTTGAAADAIRGRHVLVHCLQSMTKRTAKLPPHIHMVGIIVERSTKQELESSLQEFLSTPGPPIVYVSLGTMVCMTHTQLRSFADGLKAPGIWRIIWALPEDLQALLPDTLGDDFLIRSWLPQVEILDHPNVQVTLNHCGWGSACEAIACGKPVCGFPLFGDHSINGAILSDMGICKVVGLPRGACTTGHYPLSTFTPEMLYADLKDVVLDSSFRDAAKRWQREAESSTLGAAYAAELIVGFAQDASHRAGQETSELHKEALDSQGTCTEINVADAGLLAARGFAGLAITFAEDPEPLAFEVDSDDDEVGPEGAEGMDLPRGAQLDMLLMQSTALFGWQHGVTEWLFRLRVYRDFNRFCAYGPEVVRYLDPGDMEEFVRAAGEVHATLLRAKVPLGLLSPALDGEPHRPRRLASGLLQVADVLAAQLSDMGAISEKQDSAGTDHRLEEHPAATLDILVSAAQRAIQPAWWELL